MSLWTLNDICDVFHVENTHKNLEINQICTDSRECGANSLFFALKNELDGHQFLENAKENGAIAAVVNTPRPEVDMVQIQVPDTQEAFLQLAQAARARFTGKVVGITGSCGKTSVKNFLKTALPNAYGAEKSFNNHIGVPLTLANMPQNAEFAAIEMGTNSKGEIEDLAKMARLDVAMVTMIAHVHLEGLGTLEDIRTEKLSITKGLKAGGVLVHPEDLHISAKEWPGKCVTFNGESATVRTLDIQIEEDIWQVKVSILGDEYTYALHHPSHVRLYNSLAAISAAYALHVDMPAFLEKLGEVEIEQGRGNTHKINGVTIIDQSYNANPKSMEAAIQHAKTMAEQQNGRCLLILGDMLEMGPEEARFHQEIAPHCTGVDAVVCIGERMAHLAQALQEAESQTATGQKVATYSQVADFSHADFIQSLQENDVVMVKGSKGSLWVHNVVPHLLEALQK